MKPYYQDAAVTIYHGDARHIVPELEADVFITDPPYGVAYTSGWGGRWSPVAIAGDKDSMAIEALHGWVNNKPGAVFGSPKMPRPFNMRAVLIWDKGEHTGMGDLSFPWKPCFEEIYITGDGWTGKRTGSVLRYHADISSKRRHPTEKPLGLMKHLVSRAPPGIILDPFAGSGSTLKAAKDLNRRAVGVEIEEAYCEAAAKRLCQEVLPLGV